MTEICDSKSAAPDILVHQCLVLTKPEVFCFSWIITIANISAPSYNNVVKQIQHDNMSS